MTKGQDRSRKLRKVVFVELGRVCICNLSMISEILGCALWVFDTENTLRVLYTFEQLDYSVRIMALRLQKKPESVVQRNKERTGKIYDIWSDFHQGVISFQYLALCLRFKRHDSQCGTPSSMWFIRATRVGTKFETKNIVCASAARAYLLLESSWCVFYDSQPVLSGGTPYGVCISTMIAL